MTEKNEKADKPFYENIASKQHKRIHVHPPKPGKGDKTGNADASDRADGERRVSRDSTTLESTQRRDSDSRSGEARGERSPRGDRPDRPEGSRSSSPRGSSSRAGGSRSPRGDSPRGGTPHGSSERSPRDGRPARSEGTRGGHDTNGTRPRSGSTDAGARGARPYDDKRGGHDARSSRPYDEKRGNGERAGASRFPREDTRRDGERSYRGRGEAPAEGSLQSRPRRPFNAPASFVPVFGPLPKETRDLLESFPDIIQGVFPLDSKRLQQLPEQIRELSHELTDERSDRHVGYMNDPAELSAYIRYYMWWNLVRLTRLFVSLPIELDDGAAAVDLGSGPLTLPIALWMARPDLRKKKITWFCVDISQGALSAGEELFLSLAAKTGDEPWQITRIKGESGVSLKRKVSLVASANMFNELFWDNPLPLEAQAKHHASGLVSYAEEDSAILVIEPGIPRAGRFISLLRDSLMRLGFSAVAPCPHEGICPFPGLRYGKWCHFVFDTSDAPAKLHKLSDDAGLAKDRAALSFIFAKRSKPAGKEDEVPAEPSRTAIVDGVNVVISPLSAPARADAMETVGLLSGMFHGLRVRITSDPIKLPEYYTGRYGCSELGMVMITGTYQAADWLKTCESGSLIEVPMPDRKKAERDPKTGAIIIKLK